MHRRPHPDPSPTERQALVEQDIASTRHSRLGNVAHAVERRMMRAGMRPGFGIRQVTVFERPVVG